MLRKRSRSSSSHHKDQNMSHLLSDTVSDPYFHSDIFGHKHENKSIFNAPSLFVGFNSKNSESDAVRSPNSPLDFRIFSSLGNPFRPPRLSNEGKIWDCHKVGLSIIDSLDVETKQFDSKNVLCGRKLYVKNPSFCRHFDSTKTPNSLPNSVAVFTKPSDAQKGKSSVLFEIGEDNFRSSCSLDSKGYVSKLTDFGTHGSSNLSLENIANPILKLGDFSGKNGFLGSISASEIELSEDYTCVITHGPNPKVTHIFADCILECHEDEVTDFFKKSEDEIALPKAAENTVILTDFRPNDFLKLCDSCKKKLEGEDIYMYRGEKAFCSLSCRSREILIDEEMENNNNNSSEKSDKSSEIFESVSFFSI